jgi:hypothetical protein
MSRVLTSLHGREVGLNQNRRLQCTKGFVAGDHGKQFSYHAPSRVALFDDFLGDVLADPWNAVEGTDTDATQAVLAGAIGGALRLTTGNDDANLTVLTDLSGVTSYLNWQASNGGLVMQARIKTSRITLAYLFVGFTDVITAEVPIQCNSAETITTTASDAVGFVFDTAFTSDTWHLCGVAGDTDATTQILTDAPVADDYETLRVEVTAAGVATFFRNGVQVGTAMSGAVTPATDLTPAIYVSNTDGTSAITLDVDYIYVGMDRAADGDAT